MDFVRQQNNHATRPMFIDKNVYLIVNNDFVHQKYIYICTPVQGVISNFATRCIMLVWLSFDFWLDHGFGLHFGQAAYSRMQLIYFDMIRPYPSYSGAIAQ